MKYHRLKSVVATALLLPLFLFSAEEEDLPRFPVGERPSKEETKKEHSSHFLYNQTPFVYYGPAQHSVVAVSAFGDSLQIEDGSQWKIAPYDAHKIQNWLIQDPILITQNFSWFSNYSYTIENCATRTSVEANLSLGPYQNGPFTRYIEHIQFLRGELILNDGTRWAVSCFDEEAFQKWLPGDPIIIGYNSGWNSSSCQGLLINVTLNRCIRAEQL